MKLFILTLLFTGPSLFSFGQVKDSTRYYERELTRLQREAMDSLHRSDDYSSIMYKLRRIAVASDNYTSFNLFYEVAAADYSAFNAANAGSGFPAFSGKTAQRIGFGLTNKKRRRVFDLAFFTLGLNKEVKNGDEKIRARFSNIATLEWGYDLFKSQAINLYPYAGFSIRSAVIEYDKPTTFGSSSNLSNFVQNDQSAVLFSSKLGVQAGVNFEFVLNSNRSKNIGAGTLFFIKTGINKPVGKEKYKMDKKVYPHGITYGDWAVAAGLKFFGRN